MSQYEQFFDEADKDGNGFLTLDEITKMIRGKGYKQTDQQIKAMFSSVDFSGDNKVTKEEFLEAMGQLPSKHHEEANMRACFRDFDVDGSGSIDVNELQNVLRQCGSNISDAEAKRLAELLDKDGSGQISYEEFISHVFGK